MFFCLYIFKLCLKALVSKGKCKPILELLGNDGNETYHNPGSVARAVFRDKFTALYFYQEKRKEKRMTCPIPRFKVITME